MAHVRQDTLTAPSEWWKHLRWKKRCVAKRERRAARTLIRTLAHAHEAQK
jgi:hypothetical protein